MHTNRWAVIAQDLNLLAPGRELGGDAYAREAVINLLGDEVIESAVAAYVDGSPGAELARSVLMLVRPQCAIQKCLEVLRTVTLPAHRHGAANLLADLVGDENVACLEELLGDSDPVVQAWGGKLLLNLIWRDLLPAASATDLIARAEQHPHPKVQEAARIARDEVAWATAVRTKGELGALLEEEISAALRAGRKADADVLAEAQTIVARLRR